MFTESMSNSLTQLLLKNEKKNYDKIYLRQPRDGIWIEYTWADVMLQARKVANFLHQLKLRKGSHISIISKNCAEWFITDFGITLAGMVNVPLFPNQQKDSIQYVLDHANVKLVFVGKLDDHEKVRGYIPDEYMTVGFDYHKDLELTHRWSDVLSVAPIEEVAELGPEDLYTIIYSSGTSGSPKGAMYTHQSIANYLSIYPKDIAKLSVQDHYRFISYLPLAHVYERSALMLGSLTIPSDVSFVESLDKFAENLRQVKPTLFAAVPRIWGVFKQKIELKLPPKKLNLLLKIPLLSGFIKKKIRHELGLSECPVSVSGASHMPLALLEFFDKLGIHILEGYGQTENLAYATVNHPNTRQIGYVGTPRLEVEVKIGDNNEVYMKSPCLMSGYYKDKTSSKKALDSEGWLHTGDLGEINSKGLLKVTGRTSEIFKNQTGEFVAPTPIEKRFAVNKFVEQLCLVGSGLPSNVLLVTLNDDFRRGVKKDEIKKSLQASLGEVNSNLAKFEKISHVIIAKNTWSTNNDMITPTLKVKRKKVEEHYSALINNALVDHQSIIWE